MPPQIGAPIQHCIQVSVGGFAYPNLGPPAWRWGLEFPPHMGRLKFKNEKTKPEIDAKLPRQPNKERRIPNHAYPEKPH